MRRIIATFASIALGATVAVGAPACSRGEPPTWDGGSLSQSPLPALVASALARAVDAATDGSDDSAAPVDPGTAPQTRERPRDGTRLQDRARSLWDAIVQDNAELALPFFFPVSAYRQVKAIPSPEADWNRRLVGNFRRDVHRLHEKLGAAGRDARLVELEVPTPRARWVEPGEEANKVGYYRVYGTKLRYETDRGAAAIDVSSMISWRGEWYVVHLSGFK